MISVIVPVYNAELYLYNCLDSIKNQTYVDFEVLCINDGSSDKSELICKEFVLKDNRFHLYSQQNQGVSSARNSAISKVKGEYICFIDSDDVVDPNFLISLLKLSSDGDFPICGYSRNISDLGHKGNNIKRHTISDFIKAIFEETIIHPNICMMLFKSKIIKDNNIDFTVGCVRNEDTEFYIKYMVHESYVRTSDFVGYYYRENDSSVTGSSIKLESLTSIKAQERIADILYAHAINKNKNLIIASSVQGYVYKTARQNNYEIYNEVHNRYDVRKLMTALLCHKRIVRKGLALLYLIFGQKLFFKIFSTKMAL